MPELHPNTLAEMELMWKQRVLELDTDDEISEEEATSSAIEEYHDFIGNDEAVRELDGYFTRGEIRQYVDYANETGDTSSRYTAASILWAFAHERESIKRPDIVVGALSRIAINGHDDWSNFAESIKAGVLEAVLDEEYAKAIVESVANLGRAGYYPDSVGAKQLGLAVGTLAKLDNLELPNVPQNQELSR